jgi:hypothetical protein
MVKRLIEPAIRDHPEEDVLDLRRDRSSIDNNYSSNIHMISYSPPNFLFIHFTCQDSFSPEIDPG